MALICKDDFHDEFGTWPLAYIPYGGASARSLRSLAPSAMATARCSIARALNRAVLDWLAGVLGCGHPSPKRRQSGARRRAPP
jgi:hypothetical protein